MPLRPRKLKVSPSQESHPAPFFAGAAHDLIVGALQALRVNYGVAEQDGRFQDLERLLCDPRELDRLLAAPARKSTRTRIGKR